MDRLELLVTEMLVKVCENSLYKFTHHMSKRCLLLWYFTAHVKLLDFTGRNLELSDSPCAWKQRSSTPVHTNELVHRELKELQEKHRRSLCDWAAETEAEKKEIFHHGNKNIQTSAALWGAWNRKQNLPNAHEWLNG